jgi:glycosyltransferase involved in cell wall biosynthesis
LWPLQRTPDGAFLRIGPCLPIDGVKMAVHATTRHARSPVRRANGSAPVRALELSVVIPCLNEADGIGVVVGKALRTMARDGIDGEVVVVDNGSDDGSAELAQAAGARVVHERRRGYGSAYRAGFAAARGEYVLMGDADDTYDFTQLAAFVEPLRDGADFVIGNRMKRIQPGAMPWLHRRIGNPLLTGILNATPIAACARFAATCCRSSTCAPAAWSSPPSR